MAQIFSKFLGYGLPWVRFRAWLRAEAWVRVFIEEPPGPRCRPCHVSAGRRPRRVWAVRAALGPSAPP